MIWMHLVDRLLFLIAFMLTMCRAVQGRRPSGGGGTLHNDKKKNHRTSTHPERKTHQTKYVMPSEEERHEGTWLQWPHNYGWDRRHVERYEPIWIAMTEALHMGERVHIIVYNKRELQRVQGVLGKTGLDMGQIDFWDYPTDDVWIRDNGPIFVYNQDDKNNLAVENWMFNGWGGKADWWYDDYIPIDIARDLRLPRIDVDMVNEGGSIEVDGHGTLMAKKSSILNSNRNPGWTQVDAEYYFSIYLGVSKFIWLDGKMGGDITDDHIDGTARFANDGKTIVTMKAEDLLEPAEYDILANAKNVNGEPYDIVHLPVTQKRIGGDPGLYVNYYVGNEVVIVPIYNDENDAEALQILGKVFPDHNVTGINMEELYKDGGAAHCVTQQQPMATATHSFHRC